VKTPEPLARPGVEGIQQQAHQQPSSRLPRAQRLPAFGRMLRDAFNAGLRSHKLGGAVVVVSSWDDAKAAAPARVVCPASEPPDSFDFAFLAGLDVLVLVPLADELHGEALAAAIRDAGAALVVLAVNREPDE
jgi:hypothetical protein